MSNINDAFFNISSKFVEILIPFINKFLNAFCKIYDAACCPFHWRTADCTAISDANFCFPNNLNFDGMFKNKTGFIAERVRFSGNSQWCLTLGNTSRQNTALTVTDWLCSMRTWRHGHSNDVIFIKINICAQLNYAQNVFWIFQTLKINSLTPFCNLFMGWPLYHKTPVKIC